MTAPRSKVAASLAERGRPEMWANEQEACSLSGYPLDGVKFRAELPDLEKEGFPQVNRRNGRRFVPAIIDYWAKQLDAPRAEVPESRPTNIRDFEDTPDGRKWKSA